MIGAPGWAEKAVARLEADVAAGAVGIGEVGKGFGLSTKKADGTRLELDDPVHQKERVTVGNQAHDAGNVHVG